MAARESRQPSPFTNQTRYRTQLPRLDPIVQVAAIQSAAQSIEGTTYTRTCRACKQPFTTRNPKHRYHHACLPNFLKT